MPTSLRLDPKTQSALERLARSRSQTESEVVRQAIELLATKEPQLPFDTVADLIGCVKGGPSDLSETTGKKFRDLLAQKKS